MYGDSTISPPTTTTSPEYANMAAVASPPTTADEKPSHTRKDDATELPQLPDASHRVLTPPTSEDNDKHDGNSSELSDLEDDDDDDIGDVTPDHYWDEENGGKIPVFKPVRMHTFSMTPTFVAIRIGACSDRRQSCAMPGLC